MKKYYETHLVAYKTEEKINVEYVELDINALAKKIDIDDKTLADYYKSNISHYRGKDYPAALLKITNIRRRVDNGESFEKLAKELKGKTIISADHGEAFGEKLIPLLPFKVYGHPGFTRIPILTKVPWFIVK